MKPHGCMRVVSIFSSNSQKERKYVYSFTVKSDKLFKENSFLSTTYIFNQKHDSIVHKGQFLHIGLIVYSLLHAHKFFSICCDIVTWFISVTLSKFSNMELIRLDYSLTYWTLGGTQDNCKKILKNMSLKCVFSDKCCTNPYKGCSHCALAAVLARGLRNLLLFVCVEHQVMSVFKGLHRGCASPFSSSHRGFRLTMAENPVVYEW